MNRKELPTRMAVMAVVRYENTFLLVKQMLSRGGVERDILLFPGGRMEKGEVFYDTAIREVKEETNLDIRPTTFLGIKNWVMPEFIENNKIYHYGVDFFVGAELVSNPQDANPGQKITGIEFLSKEEIKNRGNVIGNAISLISRLLDNTGIQISKNTSGTSRFERYVECS